MSRGRTPIPTALKKARGTFRPDRNHGGEPTPPAGVPECPAHLGDRARAVWNRRAPALVEMGVLSAVDADQFGQWCCITARLEEVEAALAKEGWRMPDEGPCNWLTYLSSKLAKLQKDLGAEFGMTPSARARLHVAPRPVEKKTPNDAPLRLMIAQ